MKNIDDIFLLQRIKEDDEAAFKYLFDTYFTAVYRLSFFYINFIRDVRVLFQNRVSIIKG